MSEKMLLQLPKGRCFFLTSPFIEPHFFAVKPPKKFRGVAPALRHTSLCRAFSHGNGLTNSTNARAAGKAVGTPTNAVGFTCVIGLRKLS